MRIFRGTALVAGIAFLTSGANAQRDSVRLIDNGDSLSYVIGRDVGTQLKSFGATIKIPAFSAGVDQAMRGARSIIDSMHADSIRQSFATRLQQRMEQEEQRLAAANLKKSQAFLAQNKKRASVRTTKSGLQYEVMKKGEGPRPASGDSVRVLYKAMLLDSTVFDSTSGGQPVVLNLDRTVPGISEGIKLMNVGGDYRFYLPPDLAYGAKGVPPRIPPNEALTFDIRLVGIAGKEKTAGTGFGH